MKPETGWCPISWTLSSLILLSLNPTNVTLASDVDQNKPENTFLKELSRESDDRPLIFTTLGGGMVAMEQTSGKILWTLKDEPVVKVPNENIQFDPQFLPDPRYGNLYMLGTRAGERQVLKKLPFTIPQLVANAPCRSSDGILYTGKKIDTWFMIDPKTGLRKQVLGYEKSSLFENSDSKTCPIDPKNAIFVARTEYNVLMYDSKNNNQRWNITFFDYSSNNMGKEMTNNYGLVHFTSTSNGRIMSFDRKTGQMIWSHDMQSPVVAAYLLDREGLISVPFNSVGDDTMNHIIDDVSLLQNGQGFKHSNIELFPSLYVGEHNHGLYALSSLIDKNTITIYSDGPQPLLLEGPTGNNENRESSNGTPDQQSDDMRKNRFHYTVKRLVDSETSTGYLLLGHYSVPDDINVNFKMISSKSMPLPIAFQKSDSLPNSQLRLIVGPNSESTDPNWYEIENTTNIDLFMRDSNDINSKSTQNEIQDLNISKNSVASQTDNINDKDEVFWKYVLKHFYLWVYHQEHKGIKFLLTIAVCLLISLLWYIRNQYIVFKQLSQSGSRFSNSSYVYNGKFLSVQEELENGYIKIGKILFHPEQVIGRGCEGTFVYRGTFENRDVAVKRLLPECFSFADREVALLTESDAHANVVRYFCMEQDRLFRYIALELCSATLQEYVQKGLEAEFNISYLEVLRQATSGLQHLHSLDIVHRDIKPHNVLLSIPTNKNPVRAMISDFGLCKKLNIGRNSFSRRSGVTGTDGWIAPEMIKGERTTTSVDIFSLGCVFYYVLSKGTHPFGDVLERQAKILKGHYNLDELSSKMSREEVDLALCLIQSMLSPKSHERPAASIVYNYPLFWNKQQVLAYFQDVSDRVERDPPGGPLEHGRLAIVRGDWRGHVCTSVAADLRRYRSYNGDSVRDLLRAMRNKKHHYRELTIEAQESLGSIPNDFTMYWLQRFPRLLLHTWLQMQEFRNEDQMKIYYDKSYEFDKNFIINQIDINDLKSYEKTFQEQNNLFIKSKNYYDFSKGKPNKNKGNFVKSNNFTIDRQNKNVNPEGGQSNLDEGCVNPDLDTKISPTKNPDGERQEKRTNYNKNKKNNKQGQGLPAQDGATPVNTTFSPETNAKTKNRKKKEEPVITWTLPVQNQNDDA